MKTAVSCGNGYQEGSATPALVLDQLFELQLGIADATQYTVLGVLNVMPLHSPLLPILVPLMGAAVPETYRPRKSASVRLGAELTTRSTLMP